MLGGREQGAGWWVWEHYPGREEVAGLEGAVGDWRPDLVNKTAENNSLILTCKVGVVNFCCVLFPRVNKDEEEFAKPSQPGLVNLCLRVPPHGHLKLVPFVLWRFSLVSRDSWAIWSQSLR